MESTAGSFLGNSGTTTASINFWGNSERVDVNIYSDKIEAIYKQTSNMSLAVYPPRPPEQRVFKVVYSVVDGKWNVSEPIFGKIIAPSSEHYQFED